MGYIPMKRSENRILTTHVGSLIRPAELLEALSGVGDGSPIHDGWFVEILERSIKDVVRQQAEAGIDIINDGEFGKSRMMGSSENPVGRITFLNGSAVSKTAPIKRLP